MVSLLTFCCTSSITRSPTIVSCLRNPNNNNNNNNSTKKNGSAPSSLSPPSKQRKQQERNTSSTPSVAEIERVIGAGVFRDRDTDSDSEGSKTLFDTILSNSIGKKEGSVEKKLRETGEWILNKTETSSSKSAGKQILQTVFLLILPMWILAFLVAFGIIQLPFHSPLLDDWIM